ncbi:(R)-mandelonitrile lyase [Roseomonas populi]|uniref:(R)-mandelonitrile lyase n=1 Tax=Roseomonas populi TaxID=3121582 RepID=UPI0027E33715|nr:cupin domain-containing protein [Roseomonas pecuniae]
MKLLASLAMTTSLLATAAIPADAAAQAQPGAPQDQGSLRISRAGSQPSARGPADYFTGRVRVDMLFPATAPSRMTGGSVTFEPGARSAWHTHPVGQVLVVTAGAGWVQREGGPVEEMRPGDVVWIPPGVKHWHGAAATTGVTHIALTEQVDGQVATWMEKVSDEQYRR